MTNTTRATSRLAAGAALIGLAALTAFAASTSKSAEKNTSPCCTRTAPVSTVRPKMSDAGPALRPTAHPGVMTRFRPKAAPSAPADASIYIMPGVDPATAFPTLGPRAAADAAGPRMERLENGNTVIVRDLSRAEFATARRLPSGQVVASCESDPGQASKVEAPAAKGGRP